MQYQQIYTEKINKNLMGMMRSNLHKGIAEVHEKNSSTKLTQIYLFFLNNNKVSLRNCAKSSDECADNSVLSFVSPL